MQKVHKDTTTNSTNCPSTTKEAENHPCRSNLYPSHLAKCCFRLTPSAIKDRPAFVGEMVVYSIRLGKSSQNTCNKEHMASLRFDIPQERINMEIRV